MVDYNITGDIAQGAKTVEGLGQEARQNAAFNALARVYGPISGDPTAALQMQEYGQKQLTNPIAVNQASADLIGKNLSNTGKEQDNAFALQENPLKLQQDQNVVTSGQLANTHATAMNPMLEAQQAETNAFNALAHPLEIAHDQLANTGQGIENTRGQQVIDQSTAAFPLEQTQRQAQTGLTRAQTAEAGARVGLTHAQTQEALANAAKIGAAAKAATPAAAALVIQQRNSTVPPSIDAALSYIPHMAPIGILRDWNAKHNPGSPEAQYNKAMESVRAGLSMNDIQALRAAGTSLGRVTNTEFNAAANAFGATDVTLDPHVLQGNLARLKQFSLDIQANGAVTPGVPGGITPPKTVPVAPAAQGRYVEGRTYTDANGKSAVYSNGHFTEVH